MGCRRRAGAARYDGPMSFFAILIALLIEQARPLARNNLVHAGYRAWTVTVRSNFDAGQSHHGWLAWAMAVLPPALIVLGIHWLLMYLIGWPLAMLWNVAVLYATLGFRQFSHHFTRIRDALDAGDEYTAREVLAHWQQVDASEVPRSEVVRHVIEYSVLAATAGAINVRLGGEALKARSEPTAVQQGLEMDAELGDSDSTPGVAPEVGHLRSVVGLVWRSVVVWMLLLALLTLARLLG